MSQDPRAVFDAGAGEEDDFSEARGRFHIWAYVVLSRRYAANLLGCEPRSA